MSLFKARNIRQHSESESWQGEEDRYFFGSARPVTLLVEKHNLESAREIYEAYFAGQEIQEPEGAAEEKE
jgi:hypothetical protein